LQVARVVVAALFIAAGANHFLSPSPYVAIVPPWLPFPAALVYLSGAAEIAGGVAVLFRATRRIAGIGLIALLIAVFPANVYAAFEGMEIGGQAVPLWMLWARLPLQALLIAIVYAVAVRRRA
jgi:uncharacterized membrane protein